MNFEWLSSLDPAKAVPMALLALVFLALGFGPLKARSKSRTAKEEVETNDFRRTDDAATRADLRAQRAEAARDSAIEQRDIALEAKRLALESATEKINAARDDVHAVRNAAMVDIAAARKAAESEMQRIQHAADARVANAQLAMGALEAKVALQDREIAELREQNHECERRNDAATDRIKVLEQQIDGVLKRAQFNPTESLPLR